MAENSVAEPNSFLKLFLDPHALKGPSHPEIETPCATKFDDKMVFWGLQNLPATEAPKHFLICGATGSGKTTAIQLFLQSIAERFQAGREPPEQLIVFDAKCDLIPRLAKLGFRPEDPNFDAANPKAANPKDTNTNLKETKVWILNPYDVRSAVWNIAQAVQSPMMARHFATLVVPEEKFTNNPYFTDAAREIVYAVILALNSIKGDEWSLRDLLCALDCREHINWVTARDQRAELLADRVLEDDKHSSGVISTLATKLGKFEQVAALWHNRPHSTTPFSIDRFLSEPGILVLGNDPVFRESLWPINSILLKALTQEILRGPETLIPHRWFVLDEFRAMGRVDCVHDLLNLGRSKGASVLIGLQSVEGLTAVYGNDTANDILSQCATKSFLRAGGPQTAEWIEKYFGKIRRKETTYSRSWSSTQSSQSEQYSLVDRELFLASFFLNLPLPCPGKEYVCVTDIPYLDRTAISSRPFDELLFWRTKDDNAEKVKALVPFSNPEDQKLKPWEKGEEKFFCGEPAAELKPGGTKKERKDKHTAETLSLE